MIDWIFIKDELPTVGDYIWVYFQGRPEIYDLLGNPLYYDTKIEIYIVDGQIEKDGNIEQEWRTLDMAGNVYVGEQRQESYVYFGQKQPIAWVHYDDLKL